MSLKPEDFLIIYLPEKKALMASVIEKITPVDSELVDQAIEKLSPFVTETVAESVCYFTVNGEDQGEYDTCGKEACIKAAKKDIRSGYEKRVRISENRDYLNSGDHEDIGRCYNCRQPLNESLTWVKWEIEGGDFPIYQTLIA